MEDKQLTQNGIDNLLSGKVAQITLQVNVLQKVENAQGQIKYK